MSENVCGSFQHGGQHRVFNVPLKSLDLAEVKLSNGSVCRVPQFVSDACMLIMENVEVEGLFRKAGSAARQKEIRVSRINVKILEKSHISHQTIFK